MSELLMKKTSLQRVMRASGRVPIQCMCSQCKNQCRIPCLGTPEDIERIIDAGYGDRLALTQWADGYSLRGYQCPCSHDPASFWEKLLCFLGEWAMYIT